MLRLYIGLGNRCVAIGHDERRVTKEFLEREDVAPGAEEHDGGGVPESVGRTSHRLDAGAFPKAPDRLLEAGKLQPLLGSNEVLLP